jgi:hypothetical protein
VIAAARNREKAANDREDLGKAQIEIGSARPFEQVARTILQTERSPDQAEGRRRTRKTYGEDTSMRERNSNSERGFEPLR